MINVPVFTKPSHDILTCSTITFSREGVPVVRASTAECPETAVRSPFTSTIYTTDVQWWYFGQWLKKLNLFRPTFLGGGFNGSLAEQASKLGVGSCLGMAAVYQTHQVTSWFTWYLKNVHLSWWLLWLTLPLSTWQLSFWLVALSIDLILQLVHCLCEELVVTLVARVDSNTGGFPVLRSSSSSWFKTSITRFMPHLCFCRPPQLSGGHHEALPYRSQQGCCRTLG